ncbi:MAG: trypsin-like peptidase domain-containing protein [Bacteroidales bacterium]|jgi:hypothetical protein|nr:trypsin-like peptidase domain-containing protein [Bacteroidales bacterium]
METHYNIEFNGETGELSLHLSEKSITNDTGMIESAYQICEQKKKEPVKYEWNILKDSLKKVYCQQDNIKVIVDQVRRWLRSPKKTKPLVLLLAGTSGTGKSFTATTIAKALAKYGYQESFFSMNQYTSEADSWTFLGSRPGHTDSDKEAPIFIARRNSDKLVLIFDEIEKAHKVLLINMMTLLEKGILANTKGEKFDFKNSIIFLTSNLAMDQLLAKKQHLLMNKISIDDPSFQDQVKSIIKTAGMPTEISGRFDLLLVYNTLDAENVGKIALQEIRELGKTYGIKINKVHPALLKAIANSCKNNNEGARPVHTNVKSIYEPLFQDYKEGASEEEEENNLLDIDENRNLVISNCNLLLTIDDIVNQITFTSDIDPKQDSNNETSVISLKLPKNKYVATVSPDDFAMALGLIKIDDGQAGEGTGFIISPDGYTLTCAHCIVPGRKITFLTNNQEYVTTVIYINDDFDFAIIKINTEDSPYLSITNSMVALGRGVKMGLLAYPNGSRLGEKVSYTEGIITKNENGSYYTDANATHGSSGGALFNLDDGLVYGILRGGCGAEGANINVATDIRQMLKNIEIEWKQ